MQVIEKMKVVWKIWWEKEKMLVTNILSFSHSIFKRLDLKVVKSQDCVVRSSHTTTFFKTVGNKPFENIVGKVENACNQHFLQFQQYFLLYLRKIAPFEPQ